MEHHARRAYYVVGEGELGGDGPAVAASADAAAAPPSFRFSRLGPRGRIIGGRLRRGLAAAMTTGKNLPGPIPAGYTYLGQFIDHDLTFDVTDVALGEQLEVDELVQARSPRLDLDCLYGRGPDATGSKKFFVSGTARLQTGNTQGIPGGFGKEAQDLQGFDLPRVNTIGELALIPDKRNDENLAVAQTHLAMIRFHNRVVARLIDDGVPSSELFTRARALVVRHYQWMIRTDFLPRIISPTIVDNVFTNGRKVFDVGAVAADVPTMPIEFSVAAFRFGHSMVRRAYNWNRAFPDGAGTLGFLFVFSGTAGDLGAGVRLPSNWVADWRRLYDFAEAGRPDLTVAPAEFNRAMRIDTRLVNPLTFLGDGSIGGAPEIPIERNLAFRNLTRASMLSLASGQQMATQFRDAGVDLVPLDAAQILEGHRGAAVDALDAARREVLLLNTPLWFYILREAEIGNGRLRGVGGRLVAETFHRAMEASKPSILADPAWRPSLGPDAQTFRMVDLLLFAFNGRADLLNPLGE